jgi:hypothetical protein
MSTALHALTNGLDPRLRNRLDSLLALNHESKRPVGVTLTVGAVAGRLAATAVSQGERSGKCVGRDPEARDKLPLALPKTAGWEIRR